MRRERAGRAGRASPTHRSRPSSNILYWGGRPSSRRIYTNTETARGRARSQTIIRMLSTQAHLTLFLVVQQLYMSFLCVSFFVGMSQTVHIRTHKSAYELTYQTKIKSILMDFIWLKVLPNSCMVPYLLLSRS